MRAALGSKALLAGTKQTENCQLRSVKLLGKEFVVQFLVISF